MTDLNQRLAGLSPEKRALLMQQLSKQAAPAARREITRQPRPARIPVSHAQNRLWFLEQMDPNSATYNVPSAMWMRGRPDCAILQRSLDEIVRRHEVLRTAIVTDDVGPQQRILPPAPVPLHRVSLEHVPAAQRREEAAALAQQEAGTPFNFSTGPLLRAVLISLDEEQHLFVLNGHHIALDGWSYTIIYTELCQLYDAYCAGLPSPLAEVPLQYADYTLWQNALLDDEGETMRKQFAYWQQRLVSHPPVLELPGDRPRPAQQSRRGAASVHRLDPTLYDGLKRLSRQEGATPFMVFATAFKALLARYTGQLDLVIGMGVANRPRQELEALVGFFANTLALRTDLTGDPTFRELLARVKDGTLGAYAHQDMPVERLLDVLKIDRSLSHSPLFQVMLFFQNFPSEEIRLHGLVLSPIEPGVISSGTSRVDLTLFASEENNGLAMYIEYATDLFDAATIAAMAGHLQQLLQSALGDPDRRLSELELLTPAERRSVLHDWNDTARALPAGGALTAHALFEAQAARTPQAIALSHLGRELSYAELDQRADALARHLLARGVQPGELVGLFVKRSPDMLVALLGILKAGAAYVPLDPIYPAERIAFMLDDAQTRYVVTQRALAPLLPAGGPALVLLEEARLNEVAPPARVAAGETAYVIYTSGSTGRPKGVRLPHVAVVNFLLSMQERPGITAADRLCAVTTLSFDIAVLELLLPLTVGARIEIADPATAADGMELARLLDSSQASMLQATPATWRMLLDAGWQSRPGMTMLCGGEALSRELADRLLAGGGTLWNMYGPTETTIWSSVEKIEADGAPIAIGRPIANTRLYVADAFLQPLPPGIPGELLIGGAGVAQGYHARPELTAEKFLADPHSPEPGARLYRTGDLARWSRDGNMEVLGRIDNQVKLRGYRIELGEIEAVLGDQAGVRQAVVICREDRPGDKRLVAYLLSQPGQVLQAAALRDAIAPQLPDYMLPSAYVMLEQLPMTPNGKVDRNALPVPDSEAAPGHSYVAPRNGDEELLCGLWQEVLGLERVGIEDNFFKLGGHSLLATQLVMRAQKAFGGELSLRLLFEAPTVAAFGAALMRNRLDSVDADDLASMLDQLEGLSDDNIEALLGGALENT